MASGSRGASDGLGVVPEVMQFVGRGRLELDAPVKRLLPGFAVADPVKLSRGWAPAQMGELMPHRWAESRAARQPPEPASPSASTHAEARVR